MAAGGLETLAVSSLLGATTVGQTIPSLKQWRQQQANAKLSTQQTKTEQAQAEAERQKNLTQNLQAAQAQAGASGISSGSGSVQAYRANLSSKTNRSKNAANASVGNLNKINTPLGAVLGGVRSFTKEVL